MHLYVDVHIHLSYLEESYIELHTAASDEPEVAQSVYTTVQSVHTTVQSVYTTVQSAYTTAQSAYTTAQSAYTAMAVQLGKQQCSQHTQWLSSEETITASLVPATCTTSLNPNPSHQVVTHHH